MAICSIINPPIAYLKKLIADVRNEIINEYTTEHQKAQNLLMKYQTKKAVMEIKIRGGNEYVKSKSSELNLKTDHLISTFRFMEVYKGKIEELLHIITSVINVFFWSDTVMFGIKINQYEFQRLQEAKNNYIKALGKITDSQNNMAFQNTYLTKTKDVFGIIEMAKAGIKVAKHATHSKPSIKLENYQIYYKDDLLSEAANLEIQLGKTYAFVGPSGGGKSTMFKDLLSIPLMYPMSSHGAIYLYETKEAKTNMIGFDQDAFLPQSVTLFQSILFPKIDGNFSTSELNQLRMKVMELMVEMGMPKLIEKLDIVTPQLSGGEGKGVIIISAIITNLLEKKASSLREKLYGEPFDDQSVRKVILMDESMKGLDEVSRYKVQIMMQKYLSDATLLIIDHDAKKYNFDQFYSQAIYLKNKELSMGEISTVEVDQSVVKASQDLDISNCYNYLFCAKDFYKFEITAPVCELIYAEVI